MEKIFLIIWSIFVFIGLCYQIYLYEKFKNDLKILYMYDNKIIKYVYCFFNCLPINNIFYLLYLHIKYIKSTKNNKEKIILIKIFWLFTFFAPYFFIIFIIIFIFNR